MVTKATGMIHEGRNAQVHLCHRGGNHSSVSTAFAFEHSVNESQETKNSSPSAAVGGEGVEISKLPISSSLKAMCPSSIKSYAFLMSLSSYHMNAHTLVCRACLPRALSPKKDHVFKPSFLYYLCIFFIFHTIPSIKKT